MTDRPSTGTTLPRVPNPPTATAAAANPVAALRAAPEAAPPPDPRAALERNVELIGRLGRVLANVVEPLVPRDRPVALLDFPESPNVGDSMIWLGALALLERRGLRPCYTCSYRTYSPAALARRVGNGTILLSGGGNFGDLYPTHQALREDVIGRFRANRIVQLPQTVHFDSSAALTRTAELFDRHPDLTLLVRDEASLALARAHFRAPSLLCPDLALALGPQRREAPPVAPIVWLGREDKERGDVGRAGEAADVDRTDWLEDEPTPMLWLNWRSSRVLRRFPWADPVLHPAFALSCRPLARERLRRGTRILGSGHVVVTDRLHAHILALLLGIPHVLIDNRFGKVRRFHEAWTHPSPIAEVASDEAAALALARARATQAGAREPAAR